MLKLLKQRHFKKQNDWVKVELLIVKLCKKYGVHPAVPVSQAAVESARASSALYKKKGNLFGIEAFDSNPDLARRYPSPKKSIEDYFDLVSNDLRYAKAWKVRKDPVKMAHEIARAGYASNPDYEWILTHTPEWRKYAFFNRK